ncbi:MAG TPA: hypothetical protein PK304_08130, partial [Mobilitalea sp.]|nr:hypothetical protein [Mobilitalea sp.]
MTKKRIKYYILTAVLSFLLLGYFIGINKSGVRSVHAANKDKETVELRIIGTTDLHGQLKSFDFEQGVDYNNGGLARAFDLIKKAKAELPDGNTIVLDAGDFLFDFTTEYIFSTNQDVIQPILKAMKYVGY